MLTKEIAKQVIDMLPDESSLDDSMHAPYSKAKFERGEKQIRKGEGVTNKDAGKRLEKLTGLVSDELSSGRIKCPR